MKALQEYLNESLINESKDALTKDEISELETPLKIIKKIAKELNIPLRTAASWCEGPNWSSYKEEDLEAGDEAARKFLGDEVFNKLDLSGGDVVNAVLDKLGIRS